LVLLLLPFLLGASTPTPMIERVYRWYPLVREECPEEDPLLVLSIIAQESGGNPKATREERNGDKSVGLMQIMTFSWRPQEAWLLIPRNNVSYGCNILRQIWEKSETTEYGLAIYNCGEYRVDRNLCGPYGGYNYASKILHYWYPRFFTYQRDVEADLLPRGLRDARPAQSGLQEL